ncbi:MAG: type II toxin-antitoxin system Phd/YefM family antitoxin [Xanthomonadales bacterium]|nr:type II toxin-antitoxin system Phd/YefM family antitoxin [Xanthomonadales bacterium]
MPTITANELKTKGVSILENTLIDADEAVITVRGKEKFVVINLEKYNKIREYELEIAVLEAKADIAAGRVHQESVDDHMKRVSS